MPCPHNEITIVQRSQRQSAVAAAAYQSGEKLFCEYDQQVKHYPEKRGIVHNEILLPANAPRSYADRNTLWNAAEAVEKQWNSQLARRWVLTIPREIPPDQYAVLVREFCEQQFVSKGMIADFAIHDPHPPGHNPHAHVLLTMRAMDEHGKWLPKSRKVYDLDENGERIKLPSGRWKSHKEDTVDWNDQKYCEIWRHEWEVIQNRYLEANDRPERVDLRSYARQGLDIIPTVHEGAAVRQMEKRGIQTNIGNLNREIRAANRLMKSIRQLIQNLKGWITELGEKRKELLAQKAAEEATLLPNLLMKYMEIRKEERKDWTRSGQNRGTSQDLKAVSEALSYLQQKGLSTVEDLEAFLESSGKSAADYRNQMKPKEARSKVIDGILASRTDCKECKPVYEKYQKIFFKKTKEKFKQEHPEVARYEKAAAYLAKHPDDKDSTQNELQEEQEKLLSEIAELKEPLTEVQADLKKLRDIRYWVRKATPGTEESKEPPKKQPIKEVLQDKADEKKAQRTAQAQTKHRQQDIVPYIGHVQLNQLTPAMLDNMFQQLFDKGLSNSTVRYAQRILSVSMEHARKYRYIEHNPARDIITKFGKQAKTPDPYTIEQMQTFMSNVIGTEWEMPVVLAGMYGLRMSEIIGLRTTNIDLEKMQFGVVEQMPFKVPPGTKTITEMAPTKSNDRILPITEEALPYFLRQFDLIARQKALTEAGGGVYYDNKLFIAKPDGSPQRRDRMSANFGQLIRHLEMPHIRFHDLRHTAATNMHQLTGDFYTVGEILGHTLKGIGISLGISTNLEAVTAQYVDVRLERKQSVLQTYHKALQPKTTVTGKESGQETSKKAKKKSSEMEL